MPGSKPQTSAQFAGGGIDAIAMRAAAATSSFVVVSAMTLMSWYSAAN